MSRIHEQAREQAEFWFARMQAEDCSAQARMAFRYWRTSSPQHAEAYRATEALWRSIGDVATDPGIRRLHAETLTETAPLPSAAPRRRPYRPVLVAAALIMAVTAGGLGWWSERNLHRTGLGERLVVMLDDGSSMTLNTRTRVRVRYSEGERALELLSGEALFDVARDAARPFIVRAGDGSVVALGTRFQVRRDDDQLRVVLLEGRVAFEQPHAEPLEMAPGEQIRVAEAKPAERRVVDTEAASSWTQGRMVFRATPLEEAIAEANRYARTRIRLADPARLDIRGQWTARHSLVAVEQQVPAVQNRNGQQV